MRPLSTWWLVAIAVGVLTGLLALLTVHAVATLRGPDLSPRGEAVLAVDIAVMAIGVAGMTSLLGLHLRDLIVRPVEAATRHARAQSEGRLEERTPEAGLRESRALARALNDLAEATEKRERRMLQEASTRATSTVLSGVAHEVRNPLAAMRVDAGMLQRHAQQRADAGAEDATRQVQRAARILRGMDRLEEVVRTLQEVAGSGSSAPPDPNRLIRGALIAVQHRMLHCEPPVLDLQAQERIACDGSRVTQALMAILLNAVEASPPDAAITVRSRDEGDRVIVEVQDAGPGLPPELSSAAFDPFVTTKGGHVGLGLAMASQAIEADGGSLRITPREGGGTCARVALPVVDPTRTWGRVGRRGLRPDGD